MAAIESELVFVARIALLADDSSTRARRTGGAWFRGLRSRLDDQRGAAEPRQPAPDRRSSRRCRGTRRWTPAKPSASRSMELSKIAVISVARAASAVLLARQAAPRARPGRRSRPMPRPIAPQPTTVVMMLGPTALTVFVVIVLDRRSTCGSPPTSRASLLFGVSEAPAPAGNTPKSWALLECCTSRMLMPTVSGLVRLTGVALTSGPRRWSADRTGAASTLS